MVTRPERLVLKFADELNGTPAAAGWTLLTRKDNGKDEASELAVIDMELVPELAQQFNLGVVTANQKLTTDLAEKTTAYDAEVVKVTALTAEKATLTTEKTQLTSDLATANATIATLTDEKTALTSQVESLTSQLAEKTDELAESKAELQSQISSLEEERIVLNNKITFLESIKTYDTNKIKSLAFYDRISKDQINKLGLLAINDPQAAEIHQLLNAYKDNPWPVLLNDPLVTNGIQYLLYIEILTQEEATQLTRPATRAEAYEVI